MPFTKNDKRRARAGFTLVELMVVIAIIAMLAAIVGVNVFQALGEGEVAKAKAEISNFKTALTGYRIAYKKFPSTEQGLDALIRNDDNKKFLDISAVPDDPWGNPYVYTLDGDTPVIVSYGADGTPGGDGMNADISSENLGSDKDE